MADTHQHRYIRYDNHIIFTSDWTDRVKFKCLSLIERQRTIFMVYQVYFLPCLSAKQKYYVLVTSASLHLHFGVEQKEITRAIRDDRKIDLKCHPEQLRRSSRCSVGKQSTTVTVYKVYSIATVLSVSLFRNVNRLRAKDVYFAMTRIQRWTEV